MLPVLPYYFLMYLVLKISFQTIGICYFLVKGPTF